MPAPYVAIDTETTGLRPFHGDVPFAWAASFPDRTIWGTDWDGHIRDICEDPNLDKVFANAKFDIHMLRRRGIEVRGRLHDVRIYGHLLNGRDAQMGLGLDFLAKKYLRDEEQKVTTEVEEFFASIGLSKSEWDFQRLPRELLERRVTGDAKITRRLHEKLYATVNQYFPWLLDTEEQLIRVVVEMESRGILVDSEEIELQIDHFETVKEQMTDFCAAALGEEWINLNSPSELKRLLTEVKIYDQITKMTKPAKNRKSKKPFIPQRSTDSDALKDLHHPVAWHILVYRAAAKMINPFLDTAATQNVDNVLHANFNQCGTVSGRFSCSGPNLQNIPTEGDRRPSYTEAEAEEALEATGVQFAPHIKRIFKVRPGYVHVHMDKKQAEMVVLCHCARDKKMQDIFLRGESIHDGICHLLFGEMTKGLKQRSKAVTFGYIYGASPQVTARKAGSTFSEAVALRGRYATTFPNLPEWQRRLRLDIRQQGYILSDHGRRHYLLESEDYMAVNRICQSMVGDEIKRRMVVLDGYFKTERIDARCLLNIHDDLAIEMAIDTLHHLPTMHRLMEETAIPFFAPLRSSVDITYTRWSDLKEIDNPQDVSCIPTYERFLELISDHSH